MYVGTELAGSLIPAKDQYDMLVKSSKMSTTQEDSLKIMERKYADLGKWLEVLQNQDPSSLSASVVVIDES